MSAETSHDTDGSSEAMTLDNINNAVEGEAWLVKFKNDPLRRAVIAIRVDNPYAEGSTILFKGEGYSNFISANNHEMESAELLWPPLESDTPLDPLPYVVIEDVFDPSGAMTLEERIITRGEKRSDIAHFGRVYFRPREKYQQVQVYYYREQRSLEASDGE